MKRLISIFIITALFASCAVSGNVDDYSVFYKSYRNSENVVSFELPTSLMSLFLKHEDKELKEFLRNIDDFSFFIADDTSKNLLKELKNYLPEKLYKDIMIINDGGDKISFKVREVNETITEILMLIEENDSFIVMNIEGKFTQEDIKQFINSVDKQKVKNS